MSSYSTQERNQGAASSADISPLYPVNSRSDLQDHTRPSLFELLAEEQLRETLHPVVRYVLSYLAQRYPRYFLRVLNHHEEVFAGLLLLLERHHLKKHKHFYGLRLSPADGIATPRLNQSEGPSPSRSISRSQRWGMLLILVGLPYLRARAQDYYDRLGGGRSGEDEAEPELRAVSRKQRLFKILYPYLNLTFDATMLGYDLAYMFGHSADYRPWHRFLGLRIRRRGEEDDAPPTSQTSLLAKLPPLLPPLLLLLKLSQWWYSPTSPRLLSSSTAPGYAQSTSSAKIHAAILPPRKLPILPNLGGVPGLDTSASESEDETRLPEEEEQGEMSREGEGSIGVDEYGICPICKGKWQNPAVLPSGWVVCWRCGWEAVEGETDDEEDARGGNQAGEHEAKGTKGPRRRGRCPVTGVHVGEGQLRRVLL